MLDSTPGPQTDREQRSRAAGRAPAGRAGCGTAVSHLDIRRKVADRSATKTKSYSFVAALRPFSLVVAFASCGLGIVLAAPGNAVEIGLALAVMLGGLLLQSGVNLINDREDLEFLHADGSEFEPARRRIERNFRAGLLSFAVAAAVGLGIAYHSGYAVLVLGLVGVLGAFAYTQEPFNYKRRGLGVVCVFVLMGVLMVQGAYLSIAGELSLRALLHSLPLSALVSLLLLSNELRDLEKDAARGVKTLSVGLGYARATRLYWLLIAAAYLATALMVAGGELELSAWLLLPLPLLPLLKRHVSASDRSLLPPWTGRFLLLFAAGYVLALV